MAELLHPILLPMVPLEPVVFAQPYPLVAPPDDSDDEEDPSPAAPHIKRVAAAIAALAALLLNRHITPAQFTAGVRAALLSEFTAAGRMAAGGALDRDALDALLADKADYLDGFAADIQNGTLSAAQIAARAALWGGLVHTAYQVAKGHAVAEQARGSKTVSITWVCADDASSCDDCSRFGEGSPYTLASLPAYPGSGVQCGGNCRCDLRYELVDTEDVDFTGPALPLSDDVVYIPAEALPCRS